MKNEKHQQAKNLYFQTNLSKTEIANRLGISRRTVMLWCQQGNWERLRQSAENMPSMVAEKCYFLLDHYATHLLSSNAVISTFGPREANAINQMATSIKKLKNRSAINEAMEMFNFFLEYCKKQDPQLVDIISPLIEGYIATRRDTNVDAFVPAGFTRDGHMDEKQREQQIIESWKDEDDQLLMEEEYFAFLKHHEEQKEKARAAANTEYANKQPNGDRTRTNPNADGSPISSATNDDLPKTPNLNAASKIECHGEPRRTMTAEHGTIANKIDHSNEGAELIECHGEPRRTMTPELNTTAENSNFIMRWPDIHTLPFGYPPYTTEANMNYYHPLLTERFGIPRKTTAQYIECHGEPRRTMTATGCHPELAEGVEASVVSLSLPKNALTLKTEFSGPRRTMATQDSTPAEETAVIPSLSRDTLKTESSDLTPIQTFNLLTVLNATTKKEPDMWSRHYKALKKALPDTIDTLEDLDQLKLPPERREIVLDILRSGTPIPGWEKLQLKLLHENKTDNNQNKAA